MKNLLLYIQFRKSVLSFLLIGYSFQFFTMQTIYIFDISEPHIENLFEIVIRHGCFDTSATIMSTYNYVFYFKMRHCIFQYT